MCQATIPSPPHPEEATVPTGRWSIPAFGLGSVVSVVNGFLESNSEAARLTKERLAAPDKASAAATVGGRLTLEVVARHHSEGDAWIVVQGQVRRRGEKMGATPHTRPPMRNARKRSQRVGPSSAVAASPSMRGCVQRAAGWPVLQERARACAKPAPRAGPSSRHRRLGAEGTHTHPTSSLSFSNEKTPPLHRSTTSPPSRPSTLAAPSS